MTLPDETPDPDNRREYRAAFRFGAGVVLAALALLALLLLWVNGCRTAGADPLAECSAVQRNVLAVGPAVVLFGGGIAAFVRTLRMWRADGPWVVWQGAGWFLLVLMLLVLTMTAPLALI